MPAADAASPPSHLDQLAERYGGNGFGTILILVSSLAIAGMMGSVKELGNSYDIWQILLARTGGQLVMFAPLILRRGGALLKTDRFGLHVLRVLLAFAGLGCWFYSIANLPLAEASALSFSKSLFLVAFAGAVFGEKVGVVGWVAALVGFAGVVIMLDPGGTTLNEAALIAVLGAVAGAGATMAIKALTRTESTLTMMAYPSIGLTLLYLVPSILTWKPITFDAAPLFAIAVLSGIVSQWCFINAYRYGEASVLSIVEYARLVAAAMIGFVLFSELPGIQAVLGMALIVLASLIAMRRERIRAGIFT